MKNYWRRIEKFLHLPELEENDFKNESESWIEIENGNFNWGDENTTLKNINLKVEPNKLIAIVGSVGSGKSSLIQDLVWYSSCFVQNWMVVIDLVSQIFDFKTFHFWGKPAVDIVNSARKSVLSEIENCLRIKSIWIY